MKKLKCMLCESVREHDEEYECTPENLLCHIGSREAIYQVCYTCSKKLRVILDIEYIHTLVNTLEQSVQAHAVGVANVYNEMQLFKKTLRKKLKLDPKEELS